METEYDDNASGCWKLPNVNYRMKLEKDDGLDGDSDVGKTLPSHPEAFIMSNRGRIMNNFVRVLNGFYNSSIYYTETDISYIEKRC